MPTAAAMTITTAPAGASHRRAPVLGLLGPDPRDPVRALSRLLLLINHPCRNAARGRFR